MNNYAPTHPAQYGRSAFDTSLSMKLGRHAHMLRDGYTAIFHLAAFHLKELDISASEWQTLTFIHMFQENWDYGAVPSFAILADASRIGESTTRRNIDMLCTAQRNRAGKVIRPAYMSRTSKNGHVFFDLSPLYYACRRFLPKDTQELQEQRATRARNARQRQELAAYAAPRPRSASARQAPKEQPAAPARIEAPAAPAQELRSAAPSMEQRQAGPIDQAAAPALPEACSAVLVAFLDALPTQQEGDIPALVAFVQQQRASLDDTALLVALQRAIVQAADDIQRGAIKRPVGLLRYKIEAAIKQAKKEAAEEARRIAEQEQEEAALLADLSDQGRAFYDYGSAHDWCYFSHGRGWAGRSDWLYFAAWQDDTTLSDVLAALQRASAAPSMEQEQPEEEEAPNLAGPIEADQGEQERQADQRAIIEAANLAGAAQEQEETAPARIEAPAAPVIPFARKNGPRRELESLAARKGYPPINIPGVGRIQGERWPRFIWDTRLENIGKAATALRALPDMIEADQGEAPARIEAAADLADQGAATRPGRKRRKIIDHPFVNRAIKLANDSAAGLL